MSYLVPRLVEISLTLSLTMMVISQQIKGCRGGVRIKKSSKLQFFQRLIPQNKYQNTHRRRSLQR